MLGVVMVVVVHDDEGGGLLGVHQEVLGLPHIHQTLEGVLLLTLLVFHVGCGGGTGVPVLALVDNLSHLILLLPPSTDTISPYLLVNLLQLLGARPEPLHQGRVPLVDEAESLPELIVLQAHPVQLLLRQPLALLRFLHVRAVVREPRLQLQGGRFVPPVLLMHVVQLPNVFFGLFFELNDELLDFALVLFELPLHLLPLLGGLFGIPLLLFRLLASLFELGLQGFSVAAVLLEQGVPFLLKLLHLLVVPKRLLFKILVPLLEFHVVIFEALGLLDADLEGLPLLGEQAE